MDNDVPLTTDELVFSLRHARKDLMSVRIEMSIRRSQARDLQRREDELLLEIQGHVAGLAKAPDRTADDLGIQHPSMTALARAFEMVG